MRQSCKDIDITDPEIIYPWIFECLSRHRRRHDFRRFLLDVGGMTKAEYAAALEDKAFLQQPAHIIANEAVRQIKQRQLELTPIKIKWQRDKSSFKVRPIGCEGPMQQVLDYIAVYGASPIFHRRINACQASSMRGRGPSYGAGMIQKWARRDNAAAEYAARHGRHYNRCRYYGKLDITHCFPSMRRETFMTRFARDCGNKDLVWLWDTLLRSHAVGDYQGFLIGALPSQWAAQYIMSFIYRFAMDQRAERRGKEIRMIQHCLTYMDDILIEGRNRKLLKIAAGNIVDYARGEFGLAIKDTWQIRDILTAPIDMMGYVIHADGTITVRPRVFIRARRIALRCLRAGMICQRRARRLLSYKGFFYQQRLKVKAYIANKKYRLLKLFHAAAKVASFYDREKAAA